MKEYFNIYRRHSQPLEQLRGAKKGEFVYTSYGDCFQCIEDGNEMRFKEFHESVLNEGEEIESLEYDALNLFWVLSDKSFNGVMRLLQNNNVTDEGDEIKDTIEYGQ